MSQREQFEAWAMNGQWGVVTDRDLRRFEGGPHDGQYQDGFWEPAWRAWKSAQSHLQAETERLREAAKLAVQNFRRKNLYPDVNLLDDDDHEAWNALEAALNSTPVEEGE